MPAYAIDPVASGGDFHLRYDGTVGGTLSDGPQLLAVNLDCNNGSQVLIGHCLVIILTNPTWPQLRNILSPPGDWSLPLWE